MERILSAPGQRVRMKRFGLYFPCPAVCVGSPISWAPGCQMLTWELSPTSSFPLTPSPSSQENGGVGWRQGASSGWIPPETCLSYSVGDSLFKGTRVYVREPCFVHSIKFFFSPPQIRNSSYLVQRSSVGTKGVVAARGPQWCPWGGSSVVRQVRQWGVWPSTLAGATAVAGAVTGSGKRGGFTEIRRTGRSRAGVLSVAGFVGFSCC